MKDKLLNCPFCDSEPKVKYIGNERTKQRSIEIKCSNIKCRSSHKHSAIKHGFDWLENVCVKIWNTRA